MTRQALTTRPAKVDTVVVLSVKSKNKTCCFISLFTPHHSLYFNQ